MNVNQINKLKNKVAKKVEKDIRKRQEEEKERRKAALKSIKMTIKNQQNNRPKRGGCVCLHENRVYALIDGSVRELREDPKALLSSMEMVWEENDRRYFMCHEEDIKLISYIVDKFATIKLAIVKSKSNDSKEYLFGLYTLGKIYDDFAREFPKKSMIDFKTAINMVEEYIIQRKLF